MAGPGPGGNFSTLNVSATTVLKATSGQLFTVSVTTAGSTAGNVYDNNSTSAGNTAANLIGAIPDTVGIYQFYGWPCAVGITYVPGTGQVVSVTYS